MIHDPALLAALLSTLCMFSDWLASGAGQGYLAKLSARDIDTVHDHDHLRSNKNDSHVHLPIQNMPSWLMS